MAPTWDVPVLLNFAVVGIGKVVVRVFCCSFEILFLMCISVALWQSTEPWRV